MVMASKEDDGKIFPTSQKSKFFSNESIIKFLILNRNRKYDSRKMTTSTFTEKKTKREHHVIPLYQSGFQVCVLCGDVFGRIIGNEVNSHPDYVCIKNLMRKLLKKYKTSVIIQDNLHLLYSAFSNFDIVPKTFKNILHLFQEAIDKIEFKKGTMSYYALCCVYYCLKETNYLIPLQNLLELHYDEVNNPTKFYKVYYDLMEKLNLKKIVPSSDDYLGYLSNTFKLSKNNEQSANLLLYKLSKTKELLPVGKRMNRGIAGAIFYINSKKNNLNIPQKEIADILDISTGSVSEYTKNIKKVLSGLYFDIVTPEMMK